MEIQQLRAPCGKKNDSTAFPNPQEKTTILQFYTRSCSGCTLILNTVVVGDQRVVVGEVPGVVVNGNICSARQS